jgi:outer membrane lipoprotein-sorting protein
MFRWLGLISVLVVFLSFPCHAEQNGYQIAEKAYNIEDGNDVESDMLMKIVKADKSEKKRDLKFYRKDYGKDTRVLMVFRSPADVKDTSFLTWNYSDKDNDLWLYLPALRQVSRIAAADKSKSFMGSDYSYEDFTKRNLQKDDFTLLKEEKTGDYLCYVVEARAKDKGEKFAKRLLWIHKDNFLLMRADFFDGSNNLNKRFTASNVKKIKDIWTALSGKMENLKTGGWTTIDMSNVSYNSGLADRLFRKEGLVK